MKPGRNDPCPCGSGKKYKHCCAREDATSAPMLRVLGHGTSSEAKTLARDATQHAVPWDADVSPVPAVIETEPTARPAVVALAAGDIILASDLAAHPPTNAEGIAALICSAIETLITHGSAPPSMVRVRREDVRAALEPMVRSHGVRDVIVVPHLPVVEEFTAGLRQHMHGGAPFPAISLPLTWAAWELSPALLHRIFSTAAAFYAASPWTLLTDTDVLRVVPPSGKTWFACVLGNGDVQYGLAIYETLDDVLAVLEATDATAAFSSQTGMVVSLSLDPRSEVPKPMQREIAAARLPIAGPRAYPSIWTLNTLGGGLPEPVATDLAEILVAVGKFSQEMQSAPIDDLDRVGRSWEHGVDGTQVFWEVGGNQPYLWEVPEHLAPALPEGEHADMSAEFSGDDAADVDPDAELIARFIEAERLGGAEEERLVRIKSDVELFVSLLHNYQWIRLPAVTEYDLRVMLYDWLPRKLMAPSSVGNAVRSAVRHFFRYLRTDEGIYYPWADTILRDKSSFTERWETLNDSRQSEDDVANWTEGLYADLGARLLLPSPDLTGLGEWRTMQGPEESRLQMRLQREWLVWRDEAIRGGISEPHALAEQLLLRQETWETSPNTEIGGRTPVEVIAAERNARKRTAPRKASSKRRR